MFARLDRRSLLRRSAVGLAIPTLAGVGLGLKQTNAQSSSASPVASPAAGAETGYAPVNGLQMYYEIHGGDQSGTPLILLHGGFGTIAHDFGPTLPTFARTRPTIGVEFQAHGHTADIDRPFTYEAFADDVAGVVAYLGLPQVDLFGFSTGGCVSFQLAIRHPEIVRKAVVASATYRRDGWYPEVLAAEEQMNAEGAAEFMKQAPFYQSWLDVAPNPDDWPNLVAKTGQLLLQDYDWSESIKTIAAPFLYIISDSDSVRPEHAVELFRLLDGGVPGDLVPLPKSQFAVLPGTPHSFVTERTDLLLPIIPPFLDAPMPEGQ